jgi:hypothetical protein
MRLAIHTTLGEVRYSVHALPDDPDSQVARTLTLMRERVAQDSEDAWFRSRAAHITGGGALCDRIARAWEHTHKAIRFERDESVASGLNLNREDVIEAIIRPVDMARYIDQGVAIGDCDDFSMYLAALLNAAGVPCAFCAVAADSRAPEQYSHVYVVAYPDGVRFPLDASHGDYPGWEYENTHAKRTEWPVRSSGCCLIEKIVAWLGLAGVLAWGIREARA